MELFINNKSGAPIYDQIYNQISAPVENKNKPLDDEEVKKYK